MDKRRALLSRVTEDRYKLVRTDAIGRGVTLSGWVAEAIDEKLGRDSDSVALSVKDAEAEISRLSAAAEDLIKMTNKTRGGK